jgi:hypothetical protein
MMRFSPAFAAVNLMRKCVSFCRLANAQHIKTSHFLARFLFPLAVVPVLHQRVLKPSHLLGATIRMFKCGPMFE